MIKLALIILFIILTVFYLITITSIITSGKLFGRDGFIIGIYR